jgi:hypothetical protein
MSEKIFGCALVIQLQAILLIEADVNATNKIIYGHHMLDTAWKYKLMPENIFRKKNHLMNGSTLAKVLFYDIIWQTCPPAKISVVDADNCCNQIAHPITSLVFQALSVPKEALASMYSTIQDMDFFLCMGLVTQQNLPEHWETSRHKGCVKGMVPWAWHGQ